MHVTIDGTRVRIDTGGDPEASYVLVDTATRASQTVLPKEQAYVETKASGPPRGISEHPMTVLDRTRTIAGLEAVAHRVQAGRQVAIAWTSSARPDVAAAFDSMQEVRRGLSQRGLRRPLDVESAILGRGLPLLVQTVERGLLGPIYEITEVTAIREAVVEDDYVKIPSGYTELTTQRRLAPDGGRRASPPAAPPVPR
jgi:hypothetical protein